MTEDNEEKRFSRKKSTIKGPVIQDESSSPPEPEKPKKQEVTAKEEQKQVEEKPLEAAPVAASEEEDSSVKVKEEQEISQPEEEKSLKAAPEPQESKKDRKKREKEEKRAQVQFQRESRKKEKISKTEGKKKEKVNKAPKQAKPAKTEKQSAKARKAEAKEAKKSSKKSSQGQLAAPMSQPLSESGEPTVQESDEKPAAVAASSQRTDTSVPVNEEPFQEPQVSTAPEEPVLDRQQRRKSKKGTPIAAAEPIAEEEAKVETKVEERVETKKEKRRREKEEKIKQDLINRETRKKEPQPKIKGMKKAPPSEIKKVSEPGILAKEEKETLSDYAADTGAEGEEPEEEERVSRFSLKKFVTAYRDRQSVLVRQAEIRRFQSALFPKVMARKWQTAITPSVELPTQAVELPQVPLHMKMGLYFFRNFFSKRQSNEKLETALRKAKMPYSAIQYYSMITIVSIIAGFAGLLAISLFSLITGIFLWYAYPALGGIVGLIALMSLNSPSSHVNKRKKDIDSKLPMALAYIATMASADVPVETIMYELGKSYEYGEIAKEARAISASSRLFGNDIVTALREESKYSPSLKFSEFLQGITSTVTSGGNLKDYFTMKAVQFQSELSTVIRANAESVGVLAESYVTVGVAFPLMLLVILGVMAALSPAGSGGLTLVLYMVVLLIIPAITFGFTFLVSSTVKEVDV